MNQEELADYSDRVIAEAKVRLCEAMMPDTMQASSEAARSWLRSAASKLHEQYRSCDFNVSSAREWALDDHIRENSLLLSAMALAVS